MQDSKNSKDMFSNYFKNWTEGNPLSESFNFDQFVTANKLNTKALSEVARTIAEGGQTLARRQAQILQKNAEDVVRFFREVSSNAKNPESNLAKQADFARASIESVIEDSRELFEITSRYNNEANEIISRRVSDAIADLTAKSGSHSRASNDSASRRGAESRSHEPARGHESPKASHKKADA
jgi:phasin family protein